MIILIIMGLAESKLEPIVVKALIRQDSLSSLPSFSMDTAKFSNGRSGFIITTMDLAKNTEVRAISINFIYSPLEHCIVFVGDDDSTLRFVRDRLTGKVICLIVSPKRDNVVRFCVTNYEPLEDEVVDKIGELFLKTIST